MLAAEAMRLAAYETLCPTKARLDDAGYPTMARYRVYDSASILPDDVDPDRAYTPTLSIFTDDVEIGRSGDVAPSMEGVATAVLVVIAELAVTIQDEDGVAQVVPLAEDDASARLVLGALCGQVRQALVYSPYGSVFRKIVGAVDTVKIEAFALPQFDFRWMRSTMRFTCRIRDDRFSDEPGMPEPMKSLFEALPEGSYARAKLTELNDAFTSTTRTPFEGIDFSVGAAPSTFPRGSVS
jgi:hypothetical protein